MSEFTPWPKIARLNRDIVITEKIDGTNAAVGVTPDGEVYAQSRTRIITPTDDNFGFAKWVWERADLLRNYLGVGVHFGEWWGSGIQRNYGLLNGDKRFSLFDTARWNEKGLMFEAEAITGLHVVPVIYEGPFNQARINGELEVLAGLGSRAAPGFMNPEGLVIYHTAARQMFKVTLEGDEGGKGRE